MTVNIGGDECFVGPAKRAKSESSVTRLIISNDCYCVIGIARI